MAYKSDDVRVFSVDFNASDDDGILGTMTNPKPNAGGASVAVTGVAVNPTTANIAVGGTTSWPQYLHLPTPPIKQVRGYRATLL
jgi:hypothetical protein